MNNKRQAAAAKVDRSKRYPLAESVKLVKETSYTKFPGTVEAHIVLLESGLRTAVTLPHGTGKTPIVVVLAAGEAANAAQEAGADHVGGEELVDQIGSGKLTFDTVVATPEMMPKLARIAKIIGPKGLMPNPKTGTVTPNPAALVQEIKAGRIEVRSEQQAPVAHVPIGKISYTDEQLIENIKALVEHIRKPKITKLTLAATMGPGIQVDVNTIDISP